MRGRLALAALIGTLTPATAIAAGDPVQDAGALKATVTADPFALGFEDATGAAVVEGGALGFEGAGGFAARATRVLRASTAGGAYEATLATDDPAGRTLGVRVTRADDGVIRVAVSGPPGTDALTLGFDARAGERFLGFGERSDEVVRTQGTVADNVTEGPYQDAESPFVAGFVPVPGQSTRHDATYFPIPWLLSTRGFGVLLEGDDQSSFALGDGGRWSARVPAGAMAFKVYGGPRPADALRRFTADVGRQPPVAAPFFLGPWWQPTKAGDVADLDTLRKAHATGSLVQTYTHYLPCGDQRGREAADKARIQRAHDAGLAITTYFNPMICTGYPRYDEAAARGLLTKDATGRPYQYRYTGSSTFLVGQVDFSNPAGAAFYEDLLDEAVRDGYDGWMEDFGEYTPTDAVSADGTPGTLMHNRYPLLYHRAARTYAATRAPRPLARFNRSGWTGTAREAQIVWGGDPSTGFGFDGLASSVKEGLSMGLSGVSVWGSDIGGFFALSLPQTTPELMRRWIQAGFAQGVMRTQANGFDFGTGAKRAQITDPAVLPTWTRYSRLRTQLYPYLAAAQRSYDATGMPLMRQLALTHPDDAEAVAQDDEYELGPDLLVAPVLKAGADTRRVYLPHGRWVDFWRSVQIGDDGAPRMSAPKVLEGGREVEVPAPQDQLPLFVREGAVLPLLPADVDTLSAYGAKGVVHLGDRDRRRTLLAWPARGPSFSTAPADDATVKLTLGRGERLLARVKQAKRRRYDLQVALPRRPCRLLVGGRRAPFTYADGVLRASVRLGSARFETVTRCR